MRGIVGILLAAGIGRRFGGDKLMHPLPDGTPIAVAAAARLRPACSRVVAVLRPEHFRLARVLANAGCEIVICPDAAHGMGHSLAAGASAAADASGWIVALGDMPCIATTTHQVVAASLQAGSSIAATEFQGRRGHPVGFSGIWLPQLRALTGDLGGRAILERNRQHITLCPVDDPGVILDIDFVDDLQGMPSVVR